MADDLDRFLAFLFESREGYIYVPIKEPENQEFEQHFFPWPKQRTEVAEFIKERGETQDVYISPALWKFPGKLSRSSFKSTAVAWTEVDGVSYSSSLYEPSVIVQSSGPGNQHLYFRLDKPLEDSLALEKINRTITYSLDGDVSAWDYTQILRPPTTKNHKYEVKPTVQLIDINPGVLSQRLFANIEEPPTLVSKLSDIPPVADVMVKYAWDSENYEFFMREEQPNGSRSSAMMRLGFTCSEMGMTAEESYAVLLDADNRWGKYKDRNDREQRLIEIINKSILKKSPTDAYKSVFDLTELLEEDYSDIHWVVEDLLLPGTIGTVYSQPGLGKTRFSLQLAGALAMGSERFLRWNIPEKRKVLFLSLEMDALALQKFAADMFTPQQAKEIGKNLIFYAEGSPLDLDKAAGQEVLLRLVQRYKPEVLFIDSLGAAVSTDVSQNAEVKLFYKFMSKLKKEHSLAVWLLHHGRKAQNDNQAPKGLGDMYGSVYIGAEATTVICLYPTKDVRGSQSDPMLRIVKSRFAVDTSDMELKSSGIHFVTKHQKEIKGDSDSEGTFEHSPFLNLGKESNSPGS